MASVHFDSSACKIQKVALDFAAVETREHKEFSVFLRFLWSGPSLGFCFGFPCLRLKTHQLGSCSHYTDYINHHWNFNYYMPLLNFHNYRHQFVQRPRSLHDHEQYIHNYWLTFSEATSTNQISFPGPSSISLSTRLSAPTPVNKRKKPFVAQQFQTSRK